MATATLRDAIEKSHDVAANAVADIKGHSEDLQSDLSDYKDEIVSAAGSMYRSGKQSAQRLARSAEDMYETARDRTMDTVRSGMRTAKSHPVTTVAIAAGVGLLVGAFLMMWRR
jgi:ElaB/YqjD/DUF883 family membrane-anchored ribosome-binding protein